MESKRVLISTFLFGTGFCISALLFSVESPVVLPASIDHIDNNQLLNNNFRLTHEIELLKNENAQLKARLSARENRNTSSSVAHIQEVASPIENNPSAEAMLFAQKVEQFSADFEARLLKRMQSGPTYSYNKEMAEQFADEPVDAVWANAREMELQSFLRTHETLNHLTPESVQCKTGQCRIRIPIANIEDANNVGLAFIAAASGSNTADGQKTSTVIDMERSVIDVYFVKGDEPVPF